MSVLNGFISSVSASPSVIRMSADGDDIIVGDADTTFHASADGNIAIGIDALDATAGVAVTNIGIGLVC